MQQCPAAEYCLLPAFAGTRSVVKFETCNAHRGERLRVCYIVSWPTHGHLQKVSAAAISMHQQSPFHLCFGFCRRQMSRQSSNSFHTIDQKNG